MFTKKNTCASVVCALLLFASKLSADSWTDPILTTILVTVGEDVFEDDKGNQTIDRPRIMIEYPAQSTVGQLKNIIYNYFAEVEKKRTLVRPSKTVMNKNYSIQIKKNGMNLSDDIVVPNIDALTPREKNNFDLKLIRNRPQPTEE